jgi:hypothetical protein
MSSFLAYRERSKTLITQIQEALPERIEHIPEGWDHHSEVSPQYAADMGTFFKGGTHRTFPLLPTGSDNHDADVIDHLVKNGYTPNYLQGTASKTKIVNHPTLGPIQKDVSEKIGSILEKTGAPEHIKQAYTNDPSRSGLKLARKGDAKPQVIVFGNSARHIAGMTSGFKPADQGGHGIPSSCMRLPGTTGPNDKGGINHKYVAADSRNGSIVAFKCDHDDPGLLKNGEPDNPSSRIVWKPHHATLPNGESHTVPRPEGVTYGAADDAFSRTSDHIARTHFPAVVGVNYRKEPALYHDRGPEQFRVTGIDHIKKSIDNGSQIVERGNGLEHDTINMAIAHGRKMLENGKPDSYTGEEFIKHASQIGNLGTQHVAILHRLARDHGLSTNHITTNHGDKLSTAALNYEIDRGNVSHKMLMNPKLPASAIDKLPPSQYSSVRRSLLKPEHYDKLVKGYTEGSHDYLTPHIPYMSKENIDTLAKIPLKDSSGLANSIKRPAEITNSPHFDKSHHSAMIDALPQLDSYSQGEILKKSKFTTFADTQKGRVDQGMSLFENPHASDEELKKGKEHFIKGASEDHYMNEIPGFGRRDRHSTIPKSMSKFFTPEDHEKLARSGKANTFENAAHSAKQLEAHKELLGDAELQINKHINKQKWDDPNYDEDDGDDDHLNSLKDKLNAHVKNYANQISKHMEQHSHDSEIIDNPAQHDLVKQHLDTIDKLEHYKTDNNADRYDDDISHYQDWVHPLHERHQELIDNTARHREQEKW